jgi:hypothetical protein
MVAPTIQFKMPGFGQTCDVCIDASIAGPRVSDAWYAALASEHGCEWVAISDGSPA